MTFSIFTPTYNRAELLYRVYQSIISQNFSDLEWIVVDDGSTDNTAEVINKLQRESNISIVFLQKTNGGKHTAFNLAVEQARGDFFLCVDSDDWLSKNALSSLAESLVLVDQEVGLVAYKADASGELLSDRFPKNIKSVSLFQLNNRFHCRGEFSIVFKSEIIKRFRFPVFSEETYLGENVLYDRLGKNAEFVLLPYEVTICEYQSTGLSSMHVALMKENPAGFCIYYMQRIDLQDGLLQRLITAGKYHAFCFFAGDKKTDYSGEHKAIVALAKPLGILFRNYYKIFRGF